jgi:hypothetical protein
VKILQNRSIIRWIVLCSVFIIGPLAVYLGFIHAPLMQVLHFRSFVDSRVDASFIPQLDIVPASDLELQQLQTLKDRQLARIKKTNSKESFLHFNNILADALALQAEQFKLQVKSVDFRNSLIQGRYIPYNVRALDMLRSLPCIQWNELEDPMAVPTLNLASLELQLTVSGTYSNVFTFIESLNKFPAQVMLTGLKTMEDSKAKYYQLDIRGYYYDAGHTDANSVFDTIAQYEKPDRE